jgi:hypothetical protein
MRLIVTALYREDLPNRFVLGLRYSEWLTFEDHQLEWVTDAMWRFLLRWYGDCHRSYTSRTLQTREGLVVDVIELPRFFATLPDGTLINVFNVEVEF